MDRKGMIHLYIGNGKGKTTAATGLAIRALGRDLKVLFAQFLKSSTTGEKIILEGFPEKLLFFRPSQRHSKFLWNMTDKELYESKEDICQGWETIKREIDSKKYDVVILDEILDCIQSGLLSSEMILQDILERPSNVEVVCTGRDASEPFIKAADYITRMNSEKHPYENGIGARSGIEF